MVLALIPGEPARNATVHTVRVYGIVKDGIAAPPPVPTATPTAAPVPQPRVAHTIQEIIASYDWPVEEALRVAWCESRLNPGAISHTGDYGVFQVNARWHSWRLRPGESLLDPEVNVRIAYEIWRDWGRSWRAWVCQP